MVQRLEAVRVSERNDRADVREEVVHRGLRQPELVRSVQRRHGLRVVQDERNRKSRAPSELRAFDPCRRRIIDPLRRARSNCAST